MDTERRHISAQDRARKPGSGHDIQPCQALKDLVVSLSVVGLPMAVRTDTNSIGNSVVTTI